MNILAISTWFPFPPDNGAKARAYYLLSHIGAVHALDLLALSQSERDAEYLDEVRRFCRRVATFPEPRFRPESVRSWLGFFSPVPRYFRDHHCSALEMLSARWAREEHYDAVLAVTLGAAPYAAKLDVPFKLLDEHNVECEVIRRQRLNERSRLRRARYAPTCIKAARFERAVASKFDAIAVVSEHERQLMERLSKKPSNMEIHVIPNGVDPGFLEYVPPSKQRGLLVFTGALTYRPNYDAAVCLCHEVLPLVWSEWPRARVRITGSIDSVDVSDLSGAPGVAFTGYVDDIRPVVASASALVVPLQYGGGTRVKILEAMALGTPVISTPIGAEGLDVEHGVTILLGDTPMELAEQTSRVLADPNLAGRISRNARELVRERYQWPAIAAKLERVLAAGQDKEAVRKCACAKAA